MINIQKFDLKFLIFSLIVVFLVTSSCNKNSKLDQNRPLGAEEKRKKNNETERTKKRKRGKQKKWPRAELLKC